VSELKEAYNPKAYLENIRNTRRGLKARTKILDSLDKSPRDAATTSKETGMNYGIVMHHMKLLEAEETVRKRGKKPYTWALTGKGQERLTVST
jgi:predicted transcriptional regulator